METVVAHRLTRRSLSAGALIAALILGLALPALAGGGRKWDDGHMRSRFGGPRSASLQAAPIEGGNRFDPSSSQTSATSAPGGQLIPASQHPWSRRAVGSAGASSDAATRRPEPRPEMRHTRNPAAWSRTNQSSALRAGAVRRSSSGR